MGGVNNFLRAEGADRAEATFCGAVFCRLICFETCLTRLRLAHTEGVALFGERPRSFWQNHSQLQGHIVVRECVFLSPRLC